MSAPVPAAIECGGCVIVVDDDESVLRGVGLLLQSAGFGCETYQTVAHFLESLAAPREERVLCVLTDLRMASACWSAAAPAGCGTR